MTLPAPIEVAVPSVADRTSLESRIYASPAVAENVVSAQRRVAIMAHPYAPLGGSFDDPVVLIVADELLIAGFDAVLTFNFRRRTSWTARPEIKDYISVAYFLTQVMLRRWPGALNLEVVYGGYSYGSMIASQVPAMGELLAEHAGDETDALAARVAGELAATAGTSNQQDVADAAKPVIQTRYLLVSPVLPPVTILLTFSLRATDYKNLESHDTLVVFGTADNFTSGKKLRKWAQGLGIHFEEVEGAGHFWFEDSAAHRLKHAVAVWAASGSATVAADTAVKMKGSLA